MVLALTACTPASMPVDVAAVVVPSDVQSPAKLSFRINEHSLEKARAVIGDPRVIGYPIDAREAIRATATNAVAAAYPSVALGGSDLPFVELSVDDFDVTREIDVSGAFTHRYTAKAVLVLRVGAEIDAGASPITWTVTGRGTASAAGVADKMERGFADVIAASVRQAIDGAIRQVLVDLARRLR